MPAEAGELARIRVGGFDGRPLCDPALLDRAFAERLKGRHYVRREAVHVGVGQFGRQGAELEQGDQVAEAHFAVIVDQPVAYMPISIAGSMARSPNMAFLATAIRFIDAREV